MAVAQLHYKKKKPRHALHSAYIPSGCSGRSGQIVEHALISKLTGLTCMGELHEWVINISTC
jgi:hypothetical protein